jgi:hypothetical protein
MKLTVLTLLCTVVVSMCLRVVDAPASRPAPREVLDQQHLGRLPLGRETRDSVPGYHVPVTAPEPTSPRHIPPAIQELHMLEVGVRSGMILY